MSDRKYGGPAFPQKEPLTDDWQGMTLRDYFAASCDLTPYFPFESLSEELGRNPTIGEMAKHIASIRLAEADALLSEREGGGE